jgi:hypothetical protein
MAREWQLLLHSENSHPHATLALRRQIVRTDKKSFPKDSSLSRSIAPLHSLIPRDAENHA